MMKDIEIELKYKINEMQIKSILKKLKQLNPSQIKRQEMKAKYFDTIDHLLLKNKMALRTRDEEHCTYATVKTKGDYYDGLYSRKEWNVDITDKKYNSLMDAFSNTEVGERLLDIVEGKKLIEQFRTEFSRKRFVIQSPECILEVAIDQGDIITKNGTEKISELEIELLEGEKTCLIDFGEQLKQQFHLEPEKRSKYARGLKYLGLNE